jgi:hypothetical protein
MVADMREVELIEQQIGGLRPGVVTGDAVLVHHLARHAMSATGLVCTAATGSSQS